MEGPEANDHVPDTFEGTPDTLEGTPDTLEGTPDTFEGTPDTLEVPPDTLEGTPDTLEGTPDTLEGTPDTLEVTPDTVEGTPDTLEVPLATLEGTPDTLEGTPDTLEGTSTVEGTPDALEGTPNTLEGCPSVTAPDTSESAPDINANALDVGTGPPAIPPNLASLFAELSDDDDGPVCRVCRTSGGELFCPCLCSGSLKFCHEACLKEWLEYSTSTNCSVCAHPIRFEPVYAEDAPQRLSPLELALGACGRMSDTGILILRAALAVVCWLVIVPLVTQRLSKVYVARSLSEAVDAFAFKSTGADLLREMTMDSLWGILLCSGILLFVIANIFLKDFIRANDLESTLFPETPAELRRTPRAPAEPRDGNDPEPAAEDGNEGEPFFPLFEDEDPDGEFPALDQIVGLAGPLSLMLSYVYYVVMLNVASLSGLVLLPFVAGRCVVIVYAVTMQTVVYLKDGTLEGSAASVILNDTNASLASATAAYIAAGDGYDLTTAQLLCIGYGTGAVALTVYSVIPLPSGFHVFQYYTRMIMLWSYAFFKMLALISVDIFFFPLICGGWLGVCTLPLFASTWAMRRAAIIQLPFFSIVTHWPWGLSFTFLTADLIMILREVLRKNVLWFLRDPTDPNFHPFRDMLVAPLGRHLKRIVLSIILFFTVLTLYIYAPIALSKKVCPSFFEALSTGIRFSQLPLEYMLHLIVPFAFDRFRIRKMIRRAAALWFGNVGHLLGIHDYLIGPPSTQWVVVDAPVRAAGGEGIRPMDLNDVTGRDTGRPAVADAETSVPVPASHGDDGAIDDGGTLVEVHEENVDGEEEEEAEAVPCEPARVRSPVTAAVMAEQEKEDIMHRQRFIIQILALLTLMWISGLVFGVALICLPFLIGRVLLAPFMASVYAVYAWGLGMYTIFAFAIAVTWLVDLCKRTAHHHVLFAQVAAGAAKVLKCSLLLFLWFSIMPLLVGVLWDLTVMSPLDVPSTETIIFTQPSLWRCWTLGCVVLHLAVKVLLLGPDTEPGRRLEELRQDGLHNINFTKVIRLVIGPWFLQLSAALVLPYAFSRVFLRALGAPPHVYECVFRYSYSSLLVMYYSALSLVSLAQRLAQLHVDILDAKYKVGSRLKDCDVHKKDEDKEGNDAAAQGDRPGTSEALITPPIAADDHAGTGRANAADDAADLPPWERQPAEHSLLHEHGEDALPVVT